MGTGRATADSMTVADDGAKIHTQRWRQGALHDKIRTTTRGAHRESTPNCCMAAFAITLFAFAGLVPAVAQQPVDIEADEMEILEGGKKTIFQGKRCCRAAKKK